MDQRTRTALTLPDLGDDRIDATGRAVVRRKVLVHAEAVSSSTVRDTTWASS